MSQLNAAERRFLENATVIGAQRAIFGKLTSVGIPLRKLGEIADTTSGGTPDRNNSSYYGGQTPWLKSGELTDGLVTEIEETISDEGLANSNAKVIPKGTLLIALYGATVGKTGILGVAAATNQAVCAITPKRNEVKTPFLYWFLRHKREDFLQSSFGGAQPNISQRILRETFVPLPSQAVQDSISKFLSAVEQRMRGSRMELPELLPPLAEQRRVVARIEELAAQIHEARTLRHQAAEEAQALTQAAKRMVLTTAKNSKRPKLKEIAELRYGISAPISNAIDPALGQPIIRMANISLNGDMDLTDMRYIPASPKEQQQFNLTPGDLLLNWRSGSAQHIGKTAIFDREGDYLFASFLLRIRPVREMVLPEFLKFTMNFMRAEGVFLADQRFQVNTKLNASEFGEFEISVPPLPEQRRIVAELDALQSEVDALKRLQAETAAELDALLPAILDRAFKGEL